MVRVGFGASGDTRWAQRRPGRSAAWAALLALAGTAGGISALGAGGSRTVVDPPCGAVQTENATGTTMKKLTADGNLTGVCACGNGSDGTSLSERSKEAAGCDRAPVRMLGATGPWDAARRRPWVDWMHASAARGWASNAPSRGAASLEAGAGPSRYRRR